MILDLFSIILGFNLCLSLVILNNYRKEIKRKIADEKIKQEFDDLFTTVDSVFDMIRQRRVLDEALEILSEDEYDDWGEDDRDN